MAQMNVNSHAITIFPDGTIGPCDCTDFTMRKREHLGWCYHRQVALLKTRPKSRASPDLIDQIAAINKRLQKAIEYISGEEGGNNGVLASDLVSDRIIADLGGD